MNKKTFLRTILSLCFVIFFNIIFFGVVKKEPPGSVWISYVFVHISYLAVLAVSFLTTKGKSRDVYGLSLYAISGTYFITELFTGLLFVFLRMESFKASLVVQLLLLVVFVSFFVAGMLANEKTAESEMQHEAEVFYIKESASRIKSLIEISSDKNQKRKIEYVYDLLYSSPTKTNGNVALIERKIVDEIDNLEFAVNGQDVEAMDRSLTKINNLIKERNRSIGTYNR